MGNAVITRDLLAAIAGRIDARKTALGIRGVSYPALNVVPDSPWVMVRLSLQQPSTIAKARAGLQVVSASIDLVALVVSDPARPEDAARLDGLVEPLLDLFDANANGGNVNTAFSGLLDEHVDRIWHEARIRRMAIEWGEAGFCHAVILTLDSQFQREAILP